MPITDAADEPDYRRGRWLAGPRRPVVEVMNAGRKT
jgi:hypothetical protein